MPKVISENLAYLSFLLTLAIVVPWMASCKREQYRAVTQADGVGFYVNIRFTVKNGAPSDIKVVECGVGAGTKPIRIDCQTKPQEIRTSDFGILKTSYDDRTHKNTLYATEEQIKQLKAVVNGTDPKHSSPGTVASGDSQFFADGGTGSATVLY